MKIFPHTKNSIALFLTDQYCRLIDNYIGLSSDDSVLDTKALTRIIGKKDIARAESLSQKLHKYAYQDDDFETYVIPFNQHELWLIKNIILFISNSLEAYEFYELGWSFQEEAQDFLRTRINPLLENWQGFEEKKIQKSYYPISIEEQVALGKRYVYAFFERSPNNLDFIIDALNLDRLLISSYMAKTKEVAGEQYPLTLRSYEAFLETSEREKDEAFVLHFLPYKNQCYYNHLEVYIYPKAIVVAIYKQPWDLFAPDLIKTAHSLFEKAHRVMTGFKKMDSIQKIQPEFSLDELIKSGQRLPTLERQLPSTDFEVKNFNPKDEKYSNALKMLQCITKELLSF